MKDGLLAIFGTALMVGGLVYNVVVLRRLPRVWRGETLTALPIRSSRGPDINHRSFPAFAGWYTYFVPGIWLLLVGAAAHLTAVGVVGTVLMMTAMFVLLPLWILVNATNRPRFVVPPTRRSEVGWWSAWRARRRRKREGKPPETHEVEVLDVRPLPEEEKNQFPPYFVARCAHDDCDWMSDMTDADEPDALERVRREAVSHSARVTGPVRPVG